MNGQYIYFDVTTYAAPLIAARVTRAQRTGASASIRCAARAGREARPAVTQRPRAPPGRELSPSAVAGS